MARLLRPLASLYGWRAKARLTNTPRYRSRLPVICVGNFTAGGTGKTPFTMHIVQRLQDMGERPAILSRGYGGRTQGPHWVDGGRDTAAEVGDEPLLLQCIAPTLIARDRRAGAIAIEQSAVAPTVIVMDDGLQNPQLAKDLSIAIVDAKRGLGNGLVIPAGPLRAPIEVQLGLADAILVNDPMPDAAADSGNESLSASREGSWLERLRNEFHGPVLAARTQPDGVLDWLGARPLIAFAGIANPQRFFQMVERCGGRIVERFAFKDHHAFSERDAEHLLSRAEQAGAQLVTTEKDLVRLEGAGAAATRLAQLARALPIRLVLDSRDGERCDALLQAAFATGGDRARSG